MDHAVIRSNRGHLHRVRAGAAVAALIAALAGCATQIEDIGMVTVDPGKFTFYNCPDLIARNRAITARERELRGLMDRAAASAGGALVNALAYQSEYASVRGEMALLQKVAAEQNCALPQAESDAVIR